MNNVIVSAIAALAMVAGSVLSAAPLKLTPASPQPSGLKPGLKVRYAYPTDVKNLAQARGALKHRSEPGRPLKGLDYRNTSIGQKVLTSKRSEHVAADINGFVRFDAPGIYTLDFLTNDGLHAVVGGQLVGKFDGRQVCEETIAVDVEIPKAGWYPVKILYFQRLKTACLHMRRGLKGKRVTWMPNSAFGH